MANLVTRLAGLKRHRQRADRYVAVTGIGEHFSNTPKTQVGNAGNMLHARAARVILEDWRDAPPGLWDKEQIFRLKAEASHLVVVLANALQINKSNSKFDPALSQLAQNIRAAELPTVVLGLGAQALVDEIPDDLHIPQGASDLLDALAAHATAIGVRGSYTRDILHRLGHDNVTITGCQSCFMSLDPAFADRIQMPRDLTPEQVTAHYTNPLRERHLLDFLFRTGIDVIGQNHFLEYHIAVGTDPNPFEADPAGARVLRALEAMEVPRVTFDAYLRTHFDQFEKLDTWLDHLRHYQFCVGTRFHGSMAALQAGVPALWITHDSRTRELARFLGLPRIRLGQIKSGVTIETFLDACDYTQFRKKYPRNYKTMKRFLNRAGLPHRL